MKKILMIAILAGFFVFSGTLYAAEQTQADAKQASAELKGPDVFCDYCKAVIINHLSAIKQAKDCNMVESLFNSACEAEFRKGPLGPGSCIAGGLYLQKQCDLVTFPVFMKQLEKDLETHTAKICFYGHLCK